MIKCDELMIICGYVNLVVLNTNFKNLKKIIEQNFLYLPDLR